MSSSHGNEYLPLGRYYDTRDFNLVLASVTGNDNAGAAMRNPYCAPSFTDRTGIVPLREKLFSPVNQTVNKDVWGPGTQRLRRELLDSQLQHGWTVFQRRVFNKTPVLWMHEHVPAYNQIESSWYA